MTDAIEAQVERFAPGFRERILARHAMGRATPNPRLFVSSSSTPPGGGVHGMGGWHAAREVLRVHR
jgi:phytoene dehydrogenase-like protein